MFFTQEQFAQGHLKYVNLDQENINLVQHTEIRWLSQRSVLNKVLDLKGELEK